MSSPQTTLFQTEEFDEFVLLRLQADFLDQSVARECVENLGKLMHAGQALIFLDFAQLQKIETACYDILAHGIADLKLKNKNIEIVLLSEQPMTAQLAQSSLVAWVSFFEKQGAGVRLHSTRKILKANEEQISSFLWTDLDASIQIALQRWMGAPPISIHAGSLVVNPVMDVVAVVAFDIDGCPFRVGLSASQGTLRQLVSQILQQQIEESDPAILDGACELLNYVSAYLKQVLANHECVIEVEAPLFIPPDELMELLNRETPSRRVETSSGSFDVWVELMS